MISLICHHRAIKYCIALERHLAIIDQSGTAEFSRALNRSKFKYFCWRNQIFIGYFQRKWGQNFENLRSMNQFLLLDSHGLGRYRPKAWKYRSVSANKCVNNALKSDQRGVSIPFLVAAQYIPTPIPLVQHVTTW